MARASKTSRAVRPRRPSSKQTILAAARRLVEDVGLDAFTTYQLAVEVPISEAAIFYHFEDRDKLLLSVAMQLYEEEFARYGEVASKAKDLPEAAAAVMKQRVRFYRNQPNTLELAQFWAFARLTPDMRKEAGRMIETVWDTMEQVAASDLSQADMTPPPDLRLQIMSFWLASDGLLLLLLRVARKQIVMPGGLMRFVDHHAKYSTRGLPASSRSREK